MNAIEITLVIACVLQGIAMGILAYRVDKITETVGRMGLFIMAMAHEQTKEKEVVFTQ